MNDNDLDLDIYAILEHYGWTLPAPRGPWVNVRCGEHDDAHASATISADAGAVICHACGFKGSALSIVMRKEGLNKRDAYRHAARLSGRDDADLRFPSATSPRLSGQSGNLRADRPYVVFFSFFIKEFAHVVSLSI